MTQILLTLQRPAEFSITELLNKIIIFLQLVSIAIAQLTFTCSKLAIETLVKDVKYVQR